MKCPHCGKKTQIRSSEAISELVQKQYHRCKNRRCYHRFTTFTQVFETTMPSLSPNPKINIPISMYFKHRDDKK